MPRKSNVQLLQEALAKGDVTRAQELAKKIDTRKKSDESSYLAPSRPDGLTHDEFGGRKFIGHDGKEHTYAKRVSLEGVKFVNKFDPNGYGDLQPKHKKIDNQIKKFKSLPRPGQRGAQRDVAKKIDARCVICHAVVKVYPWEVETVDGESSFRCSKKSCVRAR